MRRFGCVAAFLFCSLILTITSTALADDGEWGTETDPCDIGWIGDEFELDLIHNDADPWKGWAGMWVRNNWCGENWGDFHLTIRDGYPYGPSDVDFIVDEGYEPVLLTYTPGSGWEEYANLTWNLSPDGSALDLFFYGNPIEQGEIAKIVVYTDNNSSGLTHCTWFKICVYPTPVPEPATVVLLGLGGIVLLRRRKTA